MEHMGLRVYYIVKYIYMCILYKDIYDILLICQLINQIAKPSTNKPKNSRKKYRPHWDQPLSSDRFFSNMISHHCSKLLPNYPQTKTRLKTLLMIWLKKNGQNTPLAETARSWGVASGAKYSGVPTKVLARISWVFFSQQEKPGFPKGWR